MITILIVEDNRLSRLMLVRLLESDENRLLEAVDGAEALALVRREHPDLIITDVSMPVVDGYEFVRQVRADPDIANTPVIFYTASDVDAEEKGCGIFRVVAKPATRRLMLKAIEEILNPGRR